MRIDSHQHFWNLDRFAYPWMPPAPNVLRQNYEPEHLRWILERNRFDGSIVVQANTDPGEVDWLLELASRHEFIFGVVGWVDLESATLESRLDHLQQHPKFRGVRHPVHDEADDRWLLRPSVVEGLKVLARRGIPYDLLLRPQHLPPSLELLQLVPDLNVVIDHIAKPLIKDHVMEPWARDMERMTANPRVHVKLSGMITEAEHDWAADDLRPYVQHVMSLFPPARLMFGSDWPVCLLAGTWKEALAAFTQAIGPQSLEVREQLLGATAARFYRISAQ